MFIQKGKSDQIRCNITKRALEADSTLTENTTPERKDPAIDINHSSSPASRTSPSPSIPICLQNENTITFPPLHSSSEKRMSVQSITNDSLHDRSALQNPIQVALENRKLWKKFHENNTEMVITKLGRRMFPTVQIRIENLNPKAYYFVLMDIVPVGENRYKYLNDQWLISGKAEVQVPPRFYFHPESPAPGSKWMDGPISFHRIKLTNSHTNQQGHMLLHSLHRYVVRVHIVQGSDVLRLPWSTFTTFNLPLTRFMAVTAYQNPAIVELKKKNNPFARGFLPPRPEDNENLDDENSNDMLNQSPEPGSFKSAIKEENENNLHNPHACTGDQPLATTPTVHPFNGYLPSGISNSALWSCSPSFLPHHDSRATSYNHQSLYSPHHPSENSLVPLHSLYNIHKPWQSTTAQLFRGSNQAYSNSYNALNQTPEPNSLRTSTKEENEYGMHNYHTHPENEPSTSTSMVYPLNGYLPPGLSNSAFWPHSHSFLPTHDPKVISYNYQGLCSPHHPSENSLFPLHAFYNFNNYNMWQPKIARNLHGSNPVCSNSLNLQPRENNRTTLSFRCSRPSCFDPHLGNYRNHFDIGNELQQRFPAQFSFGTVSLERNEQCPNENAVSN